MTKNINIIYNKLIFDDHIYSESEIIKFMLNKHINVKEIVFYPEPKFIELQNIIIDIQTNIFNEKTIYKRLLSNCKSIEPVFIKSPNVLETYYNKKNIKFKFTSNPANEDVINKEKFEILKILLKHQKEDDIKPISIGNSSMNIF